MSRTNNACAVIQSEGRADTESTGGAVELCGPSEVQAESNFGQGLSLKRNFSWTLVGNVVYAGCQWAMLVVLAKLGSPEMVGRLALGFAVTAPVIMFANLQLRAVQATDARRQYAFGDYLGLRLITVAGIALISGYRLQTALVILTIGLAKAFESISGVYYGLLQQRERMDRIAVSMCIKGALSLAALCAGVYFTKSVLWGAVGLAIMWALVLVFYDMRSGALMLMAVELTDGRGVNSTAIPETKVKSSMQKQIRVLHVIGGMNRGGAETWLMHVLRNIDRSRFKMDFLVHTSEPCPYDAQVRQMDSEIIPCPGHTHPWKYARGFKKALREHGPYDIIHSHVHYFSAYVMRLASQCGVPIRIAHSHNDTTSAQAGAGFVRRAYLSLMRRWISSHTTVGLAVSHREALEMVEKSPLNIAVSVKGLEDIYAGR